MRLLLLPISTRRALIYCEPPSHSLPNTQQTYVDKAVNYASKTWAAWEKKDKGWQLKTTQIGNKMLRRIPFEEWGLKSIPALREKRKAEYAENPSKMTVEVKFPRLYQGLGKKSILDELETIATERQGLHKSKLYWSIFTMPLTAPFMLIPVIPNLPFFYVAFRAYSHYRALTGSRHLSHLVSNNLLRPTPDPTLDSLYSAGLLHATRADSRNAPDPTPEQTEKITALIRQQMQSVDLGGGGASPSSSGAAGTGVQMEPDTSSQGGPKVKLRSGGKERARNGETAAAAGSASTSSSGQKDGEAAAPAAVEEDEEIMLLKGWNGKLIAERLGLPGLEIEIERAVEQVELQLKKGEELNEERREIETAGQAWGREKAGGGGGGGDGDKETKKQ